jgi:hypothetical protein
MQRIIIICIPEIIKDAQRIRGYQINEMGDSEEENIENMQ